MSCAASFTIRKSDKKAFIQNLKQTYEKFPQLRSEVDAEAARARTATLRTMEQDLASLQRFSAVMKQAHQRTGIPVRSLLHRLVQLRGREKEDAPEIEDLLPDYPLWLAHGELVGRLQAALTDLGDDLCFAKHPIRWLGKGILQADRPLEALTRHLDQAEDLVDGIESALELSGLAAELRETYEEIQIILDFAVRVRPLAGRNLLGVLTTSPSATEFDSLARDLDAKAQALTQAKQKTTGWRDPLSSDDTQNALTQARSFENSFLRFFQPAFWKLKKTMQARYDFGQHAVAPAWSKVLQDLAAGARRPGRVGRPVRAGQSDMARG